MNKFFLIFLALMTTTLQAQTSFNYVIQVMPPFGKVIINNKLTCPNQVEGPLCLVRDLTSNSPLTITGIKNHICQFQIEANGAIQVDHASSYFCEGVGLINATATKSGYIRLPQHF